MMLSKKLEEFERIRLALLAEPDKDSEEVQAFMRQLIDYLDLILVVLDND